MPSLDSMSNLERSLSAMDVMPGDRVLSELQHRVKNLMAVIRSIARRTVENSTSFEDFASHFDGRLMNLTRTFRILARTHNFDIDLEELVREELLSQAVGERATVEGPSLRLSQSAGATLGLAIHELATNAVKFGALAGDAGQLAIHWTLDDDGLRLQWRETGVAAVDAQPQHRGFGREWIEQGLPYQIGAQARLEFLPGGVVCTILVPHEQITDGST